MTLQPRDMRLARLFVAVVLGRWETVKEIRRAAPAGEPDLRWREALLQAHLFAGFPRAVEAYAVLQTVGGLGAPDPDEVMAEPDCPERGRELFDRIYAGEADAVRGMLERGHPDFARWVAGHAYGRVLTRPGLDAGVRELLAVAALAALGQDRQLAGHTRGALRCGATQGEIEGVLDAVADLVPEERMETARRTARRFMES